MIQQTLDTFEPAISLGTREPRSNERQRPKVFQQMVPADVALEMPLQKACLCDDASQHGLAHRLGRFGRFPEQQPNRQPPRNTVGMPGIAHRPRIVEPVPLDPVGNRAPCVIDKATRVGSLGRYQIEKEFMVMEVKTPQPRRLGPSPQVPIERVSRLPTGTINAMWATAVVRLSGIRQIVGDADEFKATGTDFLGPSNRIVTRPRGKLPTQQLPEGRVFTPRRNRLGSGFVAASAGQSQPAPTHDRHYPS